MITKEQDLYIQLFCRKFKNAVTYFDILNWLNNFEPQDKDSMLCILKLFRYYDEINLFEGFEKCIKDLFSRIGEKRKIVFQAVSEYGKSSTAMMPYFKKSLEKIEHNHEIKFSAHKHDFKRFAKELKKTQPIVLVMLDDFFGSGEQLIKYYKTYIGSQCTRNSICTDLFFMSFICTCMAKTKIEKTYPSSTVISSEMESRMFFTKNDVLGSRSNIKKISKLCNDYALNRDLFSIFDKETKVTKHFPMGYENSQSFIAFSYGTPNNTLPIIWSDKNNWFPLFPRFVDTRIDRAKKERKEIAMLLGLAITMGISNFSKFDENNPDIKYIGKENFQLFALLTFKVKRKNKLIICKLLGIMEQDYSELVEEAKKENFLDEDGNITLHGFNSFKKIHKNLSTAITKDKPYMKAQNLYMPSSFRGKT